MVGPMGWMLAGIVTVWFVAALAMSRWWGRRCRREREQLDEQRGAVFVDNDLTIVLFDPPAPSRPLPRRTRRAERLSR
jgi:hypothetical protein